jgi:hypothetical protein
MCGLRRSSMPVFRMTHQWHYASNAQDCAYTGNSSAFFAMPRRQRGRDDNPVASDAAAAGSNSRTNENAALRQCAPRKVDGEDATGSGYVANAENSMICFDAAAANGQPQPETGPVLAALSEGLEHPLDAARRQATTMILDINQDPICDGIGVHRYLSAVFRELKSILQQVAESREKHIPVDIDRQMLLDVGYRKFTLTGTRFEQCGDADLINEAGKGDELVPRRHTGGDSHVGEGPIDERTQTDQGALKRRSGCPRRPDTAGFDGREGERGRMDEVPQLVREKP